MAGYTDPNSLRVLLTRDITVPEGTAAELSDPALGMAIDTASSYIDAALANRYQVPFPAPFPALIVQLTLAMSAYHADTMHRQSVDIDNNDPVLRRHNWAVGVLNAIAAGTLDLPDVLSTSSTPDGATPFDAYTGVLFTAHDFGLTQTRGGRLSGPFPYDDGKW
jgi:phage gp36-like protein